VRILHKPGLAPVHLAVGLTGLSTTYKNARMPRRFALGMWYPQTARTREEAGDGGLPFDSECVVMPPPNRSSAVPEESDAFLVSDILMFCGRLGPLTFGMAFLGRRCLADRPQDNDLAA